MPEPLSDDYLGSIEDRVIATRPGPWDAVIADDGQPVGFGPFSWVEEWDPEELVPAIEFCREARADVPALVGEIARLRSRVTELEAAVAVARRINGVVKGGG